MLYAQTAMKQYYQEVDGPVSSAETSIYVQVSELSANTENQDAVIENDFFENRHSFLSFCEKNHCQFDSLRRAKHSSMMILYHLHKNIHLSKTDSGFGKEQFEGKRPLQIKLMGILVHASQCRATPSNPCSYSGCLKIW